MQTFFDPHNLIVGSHPYFDGKEALPLKRTSFVNYEIILQNPNYIIEYANAVVARVETLDYEYATHRSIPHSETYYDLSSIPEIGFFVGHSNVWSFLFERCEELDDEFCNIMFNALEILTSPRSHFLSMIIEECFIKVFESFLQGGKSTSLRLEHLVNRLLESYKFSEEFQNKIWSIWRNNSK